MSILIFVFVLCVLVLVHEWGHFIAAKRSGMRVDEFGIGFPPRLFGIKKGETLYSINLFPIGGFVKIYGEDSLTGDAFLETKGAFTSKSKWAQAAVLLAGVTMNVLFAWLLFVLAFGIGVQTGVSEENAGPNAKLMVSDLVADTPADSARIPRGAVIVGLSKSNEEKLTKLTPTSFSEFVGAAGTAPLTLTYLVGEEMFVTTVVPKTGIIASDPDRAAIGVQLSLVDIVRETPLNAIKDGTLYTITSLKEITVGLAGLFKDMLTLKADLSNIAGPVGIVGLVGEASALGLTSLLMFTAFISLNLAVINLLPFPALDGGRLLFVAVEAIKRSPINPRYVGTLNAIGFILLMLLMVAITWNDISRLI